LGGLQQYLAATLIRQLHIYIAKIRLISKKNMAARVGGAYFPYMSYIEKLKKKSNNFFSETTCLIFSKFGQKHQCPEGTN